MAIIDTPNSLAAAMLRAAVAAPIVSAAVVTKGAQNVKAEGRNNALQSAPMHNARAPYAINYDVNVDGATIAAEIGYDKDLPGGSLGNLLEYGSRNSAPHRDLGRALDAEETRFEDALAEAVVKLL